MLHIRDSVNEALRQIREIPLVQRYLTNIISEKDKFETHTVRLRARNPMDWSNHSTVKGGHWKQNVVNLTTSSLLVAPKVVIPTAYGTTSDDKIVKLTTFHFQWCYVAFKLLWAISTFRCVKKWHAESVIAKASSMPPFNILKGWNR